MASNVLEQHHIKPILQAFPTLDNAASYTRAMAACNALSSVRFSVSDKAQMKNAVDALSTARAVTSNNEVLLQAQKEVKEVFEKVTGIVEVGGEVPGRDGTGPDGVPSLLEKVHAMGGDEAARALLIGEIPAQVPAANTAIAEERRGQGEPGRGVHGGG